MALLMSHHIGQVYLWFVVWYDRLTSCTASPDSQNTPPGKWSWSWGSMIVRIASNNFFNKLTVVPCGSLLHSSSLWTVSMSAPLFQNNHPLLLPWMPSLFSSKETDCVLLDVHLVLLKTRPSCLAVSISLSRFSSCSSSVAPNMIISSAMLTQP